MFFYLVILILHNIIIYKKNIYFESFYKKIDIFLNNNKIDIFSSPK